MSEAVGQGWNFVSTLGKCKENCSHAMDLAPVTDGISSAFGAVKEWSKWFGREVVLLASEGLHLAKQAALKFVELIKACWELSKPWISRTVDFLKSSAGIVSLTITGSVLILALALKLEDHPAQVAMVALGQVVGFFGIWYGCSTGVIPLAALIFPFA